jgi:hypothetical protein
MGTILLTIRGLKPGAWFETGRFQKAMDGSTAFDLYRRPYHVTAHGDAAALLSIDRDVAAQVEEDSLRIGRLIHHPAFTLADKLFQPIRRGGGGSAGFNVQRSTGKSRSLPQRSVHPGWHSGLMGTPMVHMFLQMSRHAALMTCSRASTVAAGAGAGAAAFASNAAFAAAASLAAAAAAASSTAKA